MATGESATASSSAAETICIAAEDFARLQCELLELKQFKYDVQEKQEKDLRKSTSAQLVPPRPDLTSTMAAAAVASSPPVVMAPAKTRSSFFGGGSRTRDAEHASAMQQAQRRLEQALAELSTAQEQGRTLALENADLRSLLDQRLPSDTTAPAVGDGGGDPLSAPPSALQAQGQERSLALERELATRVAALKNLEVELSGLREHQGALAAKLSAKDVELDKMKEKMMGMVSAAESEKLKEKLAGMVSAADHEKLKEKLAGMVNVVECDKLKEKAMTLQSFVDSLKSEKDQIGRSLIEAEKRAESLQATVDEQAAKMQSLTDRLSASEETGTLKAQQIASLKEGLSQLHNMHESAKAELEETRALLEAVNAASKEKSAQIESQNSDATRVRASLDEMKKFLLEQERECTEAKKASEAATASLVASDRRREELERGTAALQAKGAEAEEKAKAAEAKLQDLRAAVDAELGVVRDLKKRTQEAEQALLDEKSRSDCERVAKEAAQKRIEALEEAAENGKSREADLATKLEEQSTSFEVLGRKDKQLLKELKGELQKYREYFLKTSGSMTPPTTPKISPQVFARTNTPTSLSGSTASLPGTGPAAVNGSLGVPASTAPCKSPVLAEFVTPSDVEELGVHLGVLAAEKFELESRCEKLLRENLAVREELQKWRSDIVQQYVASYRPPERERRTSLITSPAKKGTGKGAGKGSGLAEELTSKMHAVVEDTLMRNIQLQTGMGMTKNQMDVLQKHVEALESKLKSSGIPFSELALPPSPSSALLSFMAPSPSPVVLVSSPSPSCSPQSSPRTCSVPNTTRTLSSVTSHAPSDLVRSDERP